MNHNFQRSFIGPLCEVNAVRDLIERHAVGNELLERELAAEDKTSGFGLKIDIGAIGAEQDALAGANGGARELDALAGGGLRE